MVAAGYQSRFITQTVGIDVPMHNMKMECLVTEAQAPMFDQMLGTAEADFYGHQTKHGSFVFGGSSGIEGFESDLNSLVAESITAPGICRGIMKYFPALSKAKDVRSWTGWIDQCVDKVPVMSSVEEVPGLYLACGFSGHGFGICPGAAYNLAECMAEGTSAISLQAFRYDRFRAKI